ncbi:MAG: hypothetical protein JWN04_1508 [Myxococcaceae bacterium]|nr:hypothetical protein [Myxococcaceae bacterium]
MSGVRGGARAWLLACVCSAACGDDSDTGAVVQIPSIDAGMRDGSATAPLDSAVVDASPPSDSSVTLTPDAKQACVIGNGGISLVNQDSLDPDAPLGLAVRDDGATLSWTAYESGKFHLTTRWFGASSAPSDARQTPPAGAGSTQAEPTIVTTKTGFLSVWSDDAAGTFNLRAWATNASGEVLAAAPSMLTSASSDEREPVLAFGADGNALVAWQSRSPGVQGKTLLIGADSTALGNANVISDFGASAGRPALAPLGAGYVLAWVDAASRHVHMQALDAHGAPARASSQVDSEGNARGHLDFATTDQGGALVFDVLVDGARPDIRFRTFDLNGVASGPEQIVSKYPDSGSFPAIVALRGGYAVAYRSAQLPQQQLRLALLDGLGSAIASANIAPVTSINLPLALRASPDGTRMFVGWVDSIANTNSLQLQRAWIHCD